MPADVRILLLADSHLGFDLPIRPRVERRRRGHDFLANYAAALAPALAGEVDIVVHGGDVFDKPKIVPTLAYQALEPLRQIATRGVPVFIVPGNHERSLIPHARFAAHSNVHVFDQPRTVVLEIRGTRIAVAGFPCERRDVRGRFPDLLRETRWSEEPADVRVLCAHQAFEGATVGPAGFKFTTAQDVVRHQDVPREFHIAMSGHIHRHQVLTTDLRRRPLATPVLYPGSIERTSFAEMDEPKGFMIVTVGESGPRWEFRQLPARPMVRHELTAEGVTAEALDNAIRALVHDAPADAVLSIRVTGRVDDSHAPVLSAKRVREISPAEMNVELRVEAWEKMTMRAAVSLPAPS